MEEDVVLWYYEQLLKRNKPANYVHIKENILKYEKETGQHVTREQLKNILDRLDKSKDVKIGWYQSEENIDMAFWWYH